MCCRGRARCVWCGSKTVIANTTKSKCAMRRFCLILVKPSHYDDGYVIQWFRSTIPSNSLAAVFGLARDCAQRHVLGDDDLNPLSWGFEAGFLQDRDCAQGPGREAMFFRHKCCPYCPSIDIKRSHYDEDGYVIQWSRSTIPSNSLGAMFEPVMDCA